MHVCASQAGRLLAPLSNRVCVPHGSKSLSLSNVTPSGSFVPGCHHALSSQTWRASIVLRTSTIQLGGYSTFLASSMFADSECNISSPLRYQPDLRTRQRASVVFSPSTYNKAFVSCVAQQPSSWTVARRVCGRKLPWNVKRRLREAVKWRNADLDMTELQLCPRSHS
ncbi:hypothetical protein FKP32DRAFT_1224687 [Trametes sanguinea]|nr:hypothetical protein FKP32DRAFT_1224687 [Trametes sanguinea]